MKLFKTLPLFIFFILCSCTDTLIGDQGTDDEEIYLTYVTKTDLELPFEDIWYVTAGGRTHLEGAHHFITHNFGQRYAYDIIKIVDGQDFIGTGENNEDYFTFGARLNAPGDGVIISMDNDIDDNTVPGRVNSNINQNNIAGNYIMIDHLNGEYSLMAHFKKGSIIVSVGDTVVKGQEVGQAGNSGNSSGPHLHYHIQNTPDYLDGLGLPAQFKNYYADDVLVHLGEPVRDEFIRKN